MRAYYRHILLAAAVLLAAGSCSKEEPAVQQFTDIPIGISAADALTSKALLDGTSFAAAGNRIKIYDYYTPTVGAANYYIDDEVVSQGPGEDIWPFVQQKYNWTADGVHTFFGWLSNDEGMNGEEGFVGNLKFETGSKTLQIPETVLDQNSLQFDFMYSDVHVRDLNSNPDYVTPVDLQFSHLFTAFGITAQNRNPDNEITINEVTIKGLKNKNSATVAFGNTVIYNNPVASTQDVQFTFTPNLLLTSEVQSISGDNEPEYFLMWPQRAEDLEGAVLRVEYTTVTSDGKSADGEETVVLGDIISVADGATFAWEPGKINKINILFDLDQITFIIKELVAWNTEEEDIPVQL